MRIPRLYIGLLYIFCVVFSGCDKDVNAFIPTPISDTAWVQQIPASGAIGDLEDTLRLTPAVDSIQLSRTDTLSLDGMQCILPGSGWTTGSGTSYTAGAQVRGLLLNKPGDWIRQFLSTTVPGALAHTRAVVYLAVTAQGTTLETSGQVKVSFPVQDTFQGDSVWTGDYTKNLLQWTAVVPGASLVNGLQNTLTLTTPSLGWLLCGAPTSGGAAGSLTVALPNTFSNANTAVFCLFASDRALVYLQGDYASRTFIASGLPSGVAATLISLSFTGHTFYLGTQSVTLAPGPTTINLAPGLQSLAYITSYLEQL